MKKGVISALSTLTGAAIGAGVIRKVMFKEKEKNNAKSSKHEALFLMMNQWVQVKQEGKNLSEYFEKNGYKNIAIYGMSYVGVTLVDELKDTGITVAYGIDQNTAICADVDVVSMNADLEEVDAIVVTAITFFDEIEKKLLEKVGCPIISLEDIVYEM